MAAKRNNMPSWPQNRNDMGVPSPAQNPPTRHHNSLHQSRTQAIQPTPYRPFGPSPVRDDLESSGINFIVDESSGISQNKNDMSSHHPFRGVPSPAQNPPIHHHNALRSNAVPSPAQNPPPRVLPSPRPFRGVPSPAQNPPLQVVPSPAQNPPIRHHNALRSHDLIVQGQRSVHRIHSPMNAPPLKQVQETQYELRLIQEIEVLRKKIDVLEKQQTSPQIRIQHDDVFWRDIKLKLIEDTDYIKSLLRSGKMTVFDETSAGKKTLLIMAARYGNYEIAQLALNLGADIDHKDEDNRTALDHAKQQSQHHIVQLLTLNKMEANISKRVSDTAHDINKQNGIIDTMIKHIDYLKNKKIFIDTLTDMMLKIITNKESFDDNLLLMVLRLQTNPTSSRLYQKLISVCKEIVNGNNKRDWYWFKCFIIPSKVWYEKFDAVLHRYFDLLDIVNKKSNTLLSELDHKLKHSYHWDELLTWGISDMKQRNIEQPRQDQIMNGIQSKFTKSEVLNDGGASSTFNSAKHYDEEVYLPELTSLAHSVDDAFHDSVRNIFAVDKVTNLGSVATDDDEKEYEQHEKEIIYKRGPVKLIKRARVKAERDYNKQKYPTTACVVDLNRCSLVFGSIRLLLNGLRLFINKVSHYKAGNIIDIIRVKNGFKEYLKQKQYADIKLNVVIKGKHQCIIGEVQFLLRTMMDFKKVAHNLYSIQREEEFITQSVERIFPILLDNQKIIKVAGIMGDSKQLLQIMSNNGISMKMILKPDEQNQTILTDICSQGHLKAFKLIQSMISSSMLIEYLLDVRPAKF